MQIMENSALDVMLTLEQSTFQPLHEQSCCSSIRVFW
jgi:hypothetical protein